MGIFEIFIATSIIVLFVIMIIHLLFTYKILKKLRKENNVKTNSISTERDLYEEMKSSVILKMYSIRNGVHKQCFSIHTRQMLLLPRTVGIKESTLLHVFTKEEKKLIDTFWEQYNHYLYTYWIGRNGQIKTVFAGNIEDRTGEVGKLMNASEELVSKLDALIESMNNEINSV